MTDAERQAMTVECTRLASGLTVATQSMPHLESVALGVWIKSGSRNETGAEHVLHGQLRAAAPWHTWSNVHMSIGLARWESDGRVGYGDSQVAMWTDFVRAAFR